MGLRGVDIIDGRGETSWSKFANFENLSGSVWKDVLVGADGPNFMWGGGRSDRLAWVETTFS